MTSIPLVQRIIRDVAIEAPNSFNTDSPRQTWAGRVIAGETAGQQSPQRINRAPSDNEWSIVWTAYLESRGNTPTRHHP